MSPSKLSAHWPARDRSMLLLGDQPLALANTRHGPLMSFPLTDKGSWWIFLPPSPSAGCAPAAAQQAILMTSEPRLCNRTNKNRTTAPWHQQTQVVWSHLSLQSLLSLSRAPLIPSKVQPIRRGLTSSLWSVILNQRVRKLLILFCLNGSMDLSC